MGVREINKKQPLKQQLLNKKFNYKITYLGGKSKK